MDSKLQELTEKIYREGVEKGEQQAQETIAAAEKQSGAIIDGARREADEILAGARKKAEDLRQNIEADMRLSCSQAVQAFRQQITDALVFEAVDKPVAAAPFKSGNDNGFSESHSSKLEARRRRSSYACRAAA